MRTRIKIWLESDEGRHLLGKGGAEILRGIEETGSISEAARKLGMSYRYVWNYIRRMEESLGRKLVETKRGGAGGGGARLTELARELLREYERMKSYLEALVKEDLWESLGLKISARNLIRGIVESVEIEGIAAKITIRSLEPVSIKSLITSEAARYLDLKPGDEVYAVIKATEVMIAKRAGENSRSQEPPRSHR